MDGRMRTRSRESRSLQVQPLVVTLAVLLDAIADPTCRVADSLASIGVGHSLLQREGEGRLDGRPALAVHSVALSAAVVAVVVGRHLELGGLILGVPLGRVRDALVRREFLPLVFAALAFENPRLVLSRLVGLLDREGCNPADVFRGFRPRVCDAHHGPAFCILAVLGLFLPDIQQLVGEPFVFGLGLRSGEITTDLL